MSDQFNHFSDAADALEELFGQIVRKTAFDIQGSAVANAPVDTGFLRNSVYVTTKADSTYNLHGSPGAHQQLLDPIERPDDETTAYIAVGASYGIYVELGTVHQTPQPFLGPALDAQRGSFEAACETLEAHLKEVLG